MLNSVGTKRVPVVTPRDASTPTKGVKYEQDLKQPVKPAPPSEEKKQVALKKSPTVKGGQQEDEEYEYEYGYEEGEEEVQSQKPVVPA